MEAKTVLCGWYLILLVPNIALNVMFKMWLYRVWLNKPQKPRFELQGFELLEVG